MAKKTEGRKGILEMFIRFAGMQAMASVCHIQGNSERANDRLAMLQIKASDVTITDQIKSFQNGEELIKRQTTDLSIRIGARMIDYIRSRVSPVVNTKNDKGVLEDSNKLYIALAYFKVFFESRDAWVYFPLVMLPVNKQAMYQNEGDYIVQVDCNTTDVVVNQDVIRHFFDFTYEENGEVKDEFVAEHLSALVAPDARSNLKDFVESLYSLFRSKQRAGDDELIYPQINQENSSAFMFFSKKDNYKAKREFSAMINEDNPLVDAYLLNDAENGSGATLDDTTYYGSLTKYYPLGAGQATVLAENAKEKALIAVDGAPGTGKTQLILSIIAQEVTKRELRVLRGEGDYNNMMLVTSTSNKAIGNIYEKLAHGFQRGFYFVGGNNNNKEASSKSVDEYINYLENQPFNQARYETAKKEMRDLVGLIDAQKALFLEIKSNSKQLIGIKNYDELLVRQSELSSFAGGFANARKVHNEMQSLLRKFAIITGVEVEFEGMKDRLDNGMLEQLEVIDMRLKSLGFMSKVFKGSTKILAELDFHIADVVAFKGVFEILIRIKELSFEYEAALEFMEKELQLSVVNKYIADFSSNPENFTNIISCDSWSVFFRTKLNKENYELYIAALRHMEQRILQNKHEVIKALGYLGSNGGYDYLIEQYGRDPSGYAEVLRYISMAYPVFTSTLASASNLFPGFYPNKITVFRTVIADEAGMITSMDILPAFRRAKRAIVVGDPKQLAPVVGVDEIFVETLSSAYDSDVWNKYSPSTVSAFNRAAGAIKGGYENTGKSIVLDEHRRCAREIAELFIKIAGYKGINVCSKVAAAKTKHRLMMFDVVNSDTKSYRKVNQNEINMIDKLLNRLEAVGYNLATDVGIITPYQEQEAALISRFGSKLGHKTNCAKIGTVHKFQGVEFKVILFSTVCSRENDSLDFINSDPSLVNVAISRAQESFIVVGDYAKLTSKGGNKNFVGMMAQEIKNSGFFAQNQKKMH